MRVNFSLMRSFLMSPIYPVYSPIGFIIFLFVTYLFIDEAYIGKAFLIYFALPAGVLFIDLLLIIPNHFHNKKEIERVMQETKQQSTEDSHDTNQQ